LAGARQMVATTPGGIFHFFIFGRPAAPQVILEKEIKNYFSG